MKVRADRKSSPEPSGGAGAASGEAGGASEEQPPEGLPPGAKLAKDGNYYLEQNGQYYRVDTE